mgnify:FL=1
MKKISKILVLFSMVCLLSGCNKTENLEIYATSYPIEYLVSSLYKEHSTVTSIYPDGTNVNEYTLTDKQKDTYSKGDIFVYNGTTNEKQIAKDLVNTNKKLKVMDAALSLKYTNRTEELWLSPSNYLMLATNIRDNLIEQIGTKYINEEINNNYKKLEEELSIMDATIRSIAANASKNGKNTIVVSDSLFKYLENYGFNVISLEDYQTNSANLTTLKNNFKSGSYKYLLVSSEEKNNEMISEITSNGGKAITVNVMNTLSEEERKNNETYFTIMNEFITNLKTITN